MKHFFMLLSFLVGLTQLVLTQPVYAATNLAFQTSVVAGTEVDAAHSAAKAVDGDLTTYWEGTRVPDVLTDDLGAVYLVHSITIRLQSDRIWVNRTQELSIKIGTTIIPKQSYTFSPVTGNKYMIPVEAEGRLIEITGTKNTGAKGLQIAEIEVDGEVPAVVLPPVPTSTPIPAPTPTPTPTPTTDKNVTVPNVHHFEVTCPSGPMEMKADYKE